jgi:hypothetical protein
MERGLLWLPLLVLFIWLAWSGWNEYQKVEAYRVWAEQFDRAKYDICAVLGQKGSDLTWGKPTRKGPINLSTFSLRDVQTIQLMADGQASELKTVPSKGKAALRFMSKVQAEPITIPFTETSLARRWEQYLQQELQRLQTDISEEI